MIFMKVTGNKSMSSFIKIILQILFVLGIISLFAIPIYLYIITTDSGIVLSLLGICTFPVMVSFFIIYFTAIPGIALIYQFIKLFDALKKNNPFVIENAIYLKRSSITGGIISISYFIVAIILLSHSIFLYGLCTLLIGIIFLVFTIGTYILSKIFKQAAEYKEENELTI